MPAVVHTAPYLDRSARVICLACGFDETRGRTEAAQQLAAAHNREHHPDQFTYPEEPDA